MFKGAKFRNIPTKNAIVENFQVIKRKNKWRMLNIINLHPKCKHASKVAPIFLIIDGLQ